MKVTAFENYITVEDYAPFNLGLSVDCGQSFRWKLKENNRWCAIVRGRYLEAAENDGKLFLYTSENEFNELWRDYFDLDCNYGEICRTLCADEHLEKATTECAGIHILKQEPWEALCSFIISQNNNIPRIKGIIERLCEAFGDKTEYGFTAGSTFSLNAFSTCCPFSEFSNLL